MLTHEEEATSTVDRCRHPFHVEQLTQSGSQRVSPRKLGQLVAGELVPLGHPCLNLRRLFLLQPPVGIAYRLPKSLLRDISHPSRRVVSSRGRRGRRRGTILCVGGLGRRDGG